jgi:hypothetical protein
MCCASLTLGLLAHRLKHERWRGESSSSWESWLFKLADQQPSPPQALGMEGRGVGAAYKAPATLGEPQPATKPPPMSFCPGCSPNNTLRGHCS